MRNVSDILAAISDPARPRIPDRVAVVVAHPDDETLGCGALLARLDDVVLVHVTDGAPPDAQDARRHGFADPERYAAARAGELAAVLELARVRANRSVRLDVPDQAAADRMAEIARRLVPILAGAEMVLTHAYEGGHPDHDATAFAVHAAAALIGADAPGVVEMPFYRAGPDGAWLRQSFVPDGGEAPVTLVLTADERALKGRMLSAYATQEATLSAFGVADETYRVVPPPNFAARPNGGRVLYDSFGWQLDGTVFLDRARIARLELGFARPG